MRMVTLFRSFYISSSPFKLYLIIEGIIRIFRAFLAAFPAISTNSAVKYYKTADKYIAECPPTRWFTILSLSILFTLPTGNTKPAFEALDLPAATVPIFEALPFPLSTFGAFGIGTLLIASKDPVRERAFLSLLVCLLWIGAWIGWITGIGLLLSKRLSGILDTASTIEELAYASLPALSRVSRIESLGNIEKTWLR